MLNIGERAPEFELNDQDGVPLRLSDLLGANNVVLFFYPKDNTFVCTLEVCAFRDAYADLLASDALVIGISKDVADTHLRTRQRWRLPYPLLTDTNGEVARKYKVGKTLGLFAGRVTYVIDKEGIIVGAVDDPLRAERHVRSALETLKAQGAV